MPHYEHYERIRARTKLPTNMKANIYTSVVKGDKGDDGIDATHSWNGTILTITSASGTSSANLKGEKGDPGLGFTIYRTYTTVDELLADNTCPIGRFGLINTDNVEDPDNSKLYLMTENGWVYQTDLSGAQGIKGDTPVKGVDYWTIEEQQEVQNAISAANTGAANANIAAADADSATSSANEAASKANIAAETANAAANAANAAKSDTEAAISTAYTAASQANTARDAAQAVADNVESYMTRAEAAATSAEASQSAAANSESNAAASAQTASEKAAEASLAASNAATSKSSASESASAAAASEASAASSASSAESSASEAKTSETNAKASETSAASSSTEAANSETNAKASETAAASSASAAKASETAAATSEAAAAKSKTAAKASETASKTSETNAKTSETNAKASETAAKLSENNAKSSERNASASANAAASSETAASTSKSEAALYANTAAESSTSASQSATSASSSASAAANYASNASESASNAASSECAAPASANSASSSKDAAYSYADSAAASASAAEEAAKRAETVADLTIDETITADSLNPAASKAVYNYVSQMFADFTAVNFEIVNSYDALPATGAAGTFYFVPASSTGTNDMYSEYVWLNSKYEKFGDIQLPDLSPYAKMTWVTEQLNAQLASYYTKTDTEALLAKKQNTLTIDAVPTSGSANPVQSGGVQSALASKADASTVSTLNDNLNNLSGVVANKQDVLTFDAVPTASSANPVKSGGVYSALANKANTSTVANLSNEIDGLSDVVAGKQDILTFDSTPINESINPVTSGGIFTALSLKATNVDLNALSSRVDEKANKSSLESLSGIIANKQDTLTFDNAPTANSINPVKSGGVHSALATKADISTVSNLRDTVNGLSGVVAGKQDALTSDSTPTAGSSNPVTSAGIKEYVDSQSVKIEYLSNADFLALLGMSN